MTVATVVVVEDDPTNRLLITQILRKHDFDVLAAPDGLLGLQLVRDLEPDVVVTDIQMPNMDGVSLLRALRDNAITVSIPVLMLTSLAERADMRQSMAAGADDYITKPFTPNELVDAVRAQLRKRDGLRDSQEGSVRKAIDSALELQRHNIAGVYEKRLKQELSMAAGKDTIPAVRDETYPVATVLCADLLAPSWLIHLGAQDQAALLKASYSQATDTLSLFGARAVHLSGDRLLAVFTPDTDTETVNHAQRGLKSALALQASAERVAGHLRQRHPQQRWQDFTRAQALHTGEVAIVGMLTSERAADLHGVPMGSAVNWALRLQLEAGVQGRRMLASAPTLGLLAGAAVEMLAQEVAGAHPDDTLAVGEVHALASPPDGATPA